MWEGSKGAVMSEDLKTRDIARLLHVSEETVRQYARDGRIPCETTPGGHRRFNADAVRAALAAEKESLPSVGDSRLRELRYKRVAINFDAPAPSMPIATEAAALGAFERREALPVPSTSNPVHAALMRWADPARIPRGAGH
jgi:excisionase family DNA binding protein